MDEILSHKIVNQKPFYVVNKRYNDSTESYWVLIEVHNSNLAHWIISKPSTLWCNMSLDGYYSCFSISEELYTLLVLSWE